MGWSSPGLAGLELGMVMSAVNDGDHNGRASLGGLDLRDDCVWLPRGQRDDGSEGMLLPIAALSSITIERGDQGIRYLMDYTG